MNPHVRYCRLQLQLGRSFLKRGELEKASDCFRRCGDALDNVELEVDDLTSMLAELSSDVVKRLGALPPPN